MAPTESKERSVVIIGGGAAGLPAAYELAKHQVPAVVLEADKIVGGISRTVNYKGYLFDIGGHRFFTKWPEVNALWKKIMGDQFLARPRPSRLLFPKKIFYF